jgi:hypothetical protein
MLKRFLGEMTMFVTMQNADLVTKLTLLADEDIELVKAAIRASAAPGDGAKLKDVVKYIVLHRRREPHFLQKDRVAQHTTP